MNHDNSLTLYSGVEIGMNRDSIVHAVSSNEEGYSVPRNFNVNLLSFCTIYRNFTFDVDLSTFSNTTTFPRLEII